MKKLLITLTIMFGCFLTRGQTLNELAIITGSDIVLPNNFGESVSYDGDYAIVGAPSKDYVYQGNTLNGVGAVYVFKKDSNGNWSEVQKLIPSNISIDNRNDRFGTSVAISGKYAIVGAPQPSGYQNNANKKGVVYVFERNQDGVWLEVQKLVGSDSVMKDSFGTGLVLDGENMLIGASGVDVNNVSSVGRVYAFSRNSSGFWEETQKILPSELQQGGIFGRSIAIDGKKAIVGYFDDGPNQSIDRQGSAYIYEQDSNGVWSQSQKIVASDGTAKDLFGGSVGIEGNYVVVGAYSDKDEQNPSAATNRGSIYIFEQDSTGSWNERQKIVPSYYSFPDKLFGYSVSINNDFIVVGAPFEDFDANTNTDEGALYIYEHDVISNLWVENQRIVSSDLKQHNQFGINVILQDDTLIALSTGNAFFNVRGSVYFYEFCRNISISDTNFEQWLVDEQIDSDGLVNGGISDCDAKKVTELNIPPLQGIADLTGISAFTNLEVLSIPENDLVTLDLSNNTKLISVNCYFNFLEQIDITNCGQLASLNVSDNFLTALNISGINDLQSLDARTNQDLSCIQVKDLAEAEAKSSGRRPQWRVDASSSFSLNCPTNVVRSSLSKYEKLRIRNEKLTKNNVFLFPTRIRNGKLTILTEGSMYFDVLIYDLHGSLTKEFRSISKVNDLDVSKLSPGLYVAKIYQGGKEIVKKFIIER